MKLSIFILMLFACGSSHANKLLYDKLKVLAYLSKEIKLNKQVIKGSVAAGAKASTVNVLSLNSELNEQWCLNYKVPFIEKSIEGGLTLVKSSNCNDTLLQKSDFFIDNVSTFQVEQFKHITLTINDEIIKLIPLTYNNNSKIISWNKNEVHRKKTIGTDFILDDKDLLICHDFNKDCSQRVENNCNQCQFGFFTGASSLCPGKDVKYCGISTCGMRNMPACPRGERHSEVVALYGCQNGSLSGFCEQGLEVYCENGHLYCR